ncbi:HupE/UreJ family protein [Pleurocapsales cyanobacterium LEGE 06147]|nr:HupE/UreJ family protein [Pleurocapsales cyanobacterium LEGE 06147]
MKLLHLNSGSFLSRISLFFGLGIALVLLIATEPATAHHALAGKTPNNFLEGFMSGLAHPIIGLDHFAFVVAVGLLAALKNKQGMSIPIAFILTTLVGTGIHLLEIDLPFPEIVISVSVLAFGILLTQKNSLNLLWLIASAAVAGIFHGYAYGESIVGAEMTPVISYLAGFAIIQLVITLIAFRVGKLTLKQVTDLPSLSLRFAGFTICGAGIVLLASAILG